jgi:hypothetical protein
LTFVVPNISPEEARTVLSRRRKLPLGRKREMRNMRLLYLPYYVHKVVVLQGNEEHEIVTCTDGISSDFSFFNVKGLDFCDEGSGEVFDFLVSPEEAGRACMNNLRWHLVRQALRLKVKPSVKEIREMQRIHYPYWVAYFKGHRGYDFSVADAVTGEIQGAPMRKTFLTAFSQAGASADG